jgi:hypothetical protein
MLEGILDFGFQNSDLRIQNSDLKHSFPGKRFTGLVHKERNDERSVATRAAKCYYCRQNHKKSPRCCKGLL